MVAVKLVALFVYLFGASAYGAATAVGLRRTKPIWGAASEDPAGAGSPVDRVTLAVFGLGFVWFALQALIELRTLLIDPGVNWLDLLRLVAYAFPPLIMHTVYRESACREGGSPQRLYRRLLAAMYVLSPAIGVYLLAAAFRWVPRPEPLGAWRGFSMGAMFTLAGAYSATLMIRRPGRDATRDGRTRRVMVLLFALLSALFIALRLSFLYRRRLVAEILDHAARAAPVYFLIASVYFENRFAFYDLVVKRATLLLMSLVSLSFYLAATMPWLDRQPAGPARPWLCTVTLAPLGLVMPWLYTRSERWFDRIWLGREYTA
jgi:hypothetical protein